MATEKSTSSGVKIVAAVAAIVVGVFLVFFPSTPALADGIFVAALALAAAVFLWTGVTTAQARTVAIVLLVLAAYALIRGFGLLELNLLRQVGGIIAIGAGAVLLWPAVRGKLGK
jgi:hypothetical protein